MRVMKVLFILFMISSCHFLVKAGDIIQITAVTRNLVPKSKSTDAIDGDWIMKNDKVIAIIGNAVYGREANFRAQSVQGAVIDFTSLADNNDYLDAYYPQGFPGEDSRRNPALFADKIEVLKSNGPEIILRAVRKPTDKVPYESVTEYTLKDGENFLRIKTMYLNPGKQNVSLIFADKLRLDYDIVNEASCIGKHKLAFIYSKWFKAAYGIYCPKGVLITEKPKTGGGPDVGLLVVYQDVKMTGNATINLEPGQRAEVTRYLLYGKDVAEIQRNVMGFDKTNAVITTLKITDIYNKQIEGVLLDVFDNRDSLISFAITNKIGIAEIPLMAGDYKFKATKVGHDTINNNFTTTQKPLIISAIMKPLTSIDFIVKEEGTTRMLPVKVEFRGINGSPDPYLGSPKQAEGANNLYYAIKSPFQVPVSPGQYLIVISHGPEYETVKQKVAVIRGETKSIIVDIRRVFSSQEWIIADLHSHSIVSGDCSVETRSRVINSAGIGIEFAPATEHNRISSYSDEINRLGLEEYIASANGLELTGPTGVAGGPNHQNAFPLTLQLGKQSGGCPAVSADVYTQVKALYDYDKGKVKFLQHNHPGAGIPNLYFDKNRDGILDNGYETRGFTDAFELESYFFEILNVTSDESKNKKAPVFYWLQMLNQGDRLFGTTTSDSHTIGERRGLRFIYIHTKKDNPLTIDPSDIALNAKLGHIIMTNGPFLKTDINGSLPGDEIKSMSAGLKMNIEVYANNDIEIDRVQVLVNGRQDKNLNFTIESNPNLFTQGSMQFKHTFPLALDKDANVIVVATGKKRSLDAQLTNKEILQAPIAVANPYFIDVNGDGYIANKDILGEPLPVSSRANR